MVGSSNPNSQEKMVGLASMIIGVLLLLMVISWIYSTVTKGKRDCNTMNKIYKDFPLIKSMNMTNTDFNYNLRDYYVKTAYNCCAPGNYKNSFVNVCALKDCIRQGARCLDFQIYSLNESPVIAVSSVEDFNTKESYNSIPFATAMKVVNDYAFSGSNCPNPADPLILHFRILSKNTSILDDMAEDLYNTLESKMLGSEYSYEYGGKNLGIVPLKNFQGKVIIIVDNNYTKAVGSKFDEYVNIASGSVFMQASRYYDIKYTPDMTELIEFNKKQMTICLPDISTSPINPSSSLAMKYGCQFVAMCFQNFDSNMEYYDLFFDNEGSAFALKPESLRYIPVEIDVPDPPPQSYSYEPRTVSSDYYNFNI